MKEKFLYILENEKVYEVIPFLEKLNDSDKKNLTPILKEKIKKYQEYDHSGKHSKLTGTHKQFTILSICAFVCFNLNEYKRNKISLSYLSKGFIKFHEYTQKEEMSRISIDNILDWYCPDWLTEYLNDIKANEKFATENYFTLMEWYTKGYVKELSPELSAETLFNMPFSHTYDKDWKRIGHYHPEVVLKYPLTLEKHIWYLFDIPTDICYDQLYSKDGQNWAYIFRWLDKEKKIDRNKLLTSILSTYTKSIFNRTQINWFVDCFEIQEPTKEEMIVLQSNLYNALYSNQTKVVSNILSHISKICLDKAFDKDTFLSKLPTLFSSTTKNVLNATIAICTTILERNKQDADFICAALCNGFLNKDQAIQKKVANLLVQYGTPEKLKEYLTDYIDYISVAIQPILADFIEKKGKESEIVEESPIVVDIPAAISSATKIQEITSFEDFVFFANQAFNNNTPHDSILFPYYLNYYSQNITVEQLNQLEPVFKTASKVLEIYGAKMGNIERLFARFLISYGKYITEKFPVISDNIKRIIEKNQKYDLNDCDSILQYFPILYPFYYMLLYTFNNIVAEKCIKHLSLPTHSPLWIESEILVQRLVKQQESNQTPYDIDVMLALQRCNLTQTEKALQLVKSKLKGELQELMIYLFEPKAQCKQNPENLSWWLTASMLKPQENLSNIWKQYGTSKIPGVYYTGDFKWEIAENEDGIKFFDIDFPQPVSKKIEEVTFLAAYTLMGKDDLLIWAPDIKRLLCSFPYNHNVITADILSLVDDYKSLDSFDKAKFIETLQTLLELKLPLNDMDYLLLAICMLASDKEVKRNASEFWIYYTTRNDFENEKVGKLLGELLKSELVPTKRLTDLISDSMMNISKQHNRYLEKLIESLIVKMDTPVAGLKKMLEIYHELLLLNKGKVSTDKIPQLERWLNENSLKPILKQILS